MEPLESRHLLTATPFGADEMDTGEFMLGEIYVTVVGFESDGSRDANTETWNEAYRNQVKTNVQEGLQWWEQTLDIQFPNHQHELNFQIDFTHLDTPIATGYEPISRPSYDFQLWTADFFSHVGFNRGNFSTSSRAFNHAQREANGTDWAFTIFVVNDEVDTDGNFEPGGFSRAFAFAGGRFFVVPAHRPDSTYAHETGHMFWAKDEYRGGGSYTDERGYYNAQNTNGWDNPDFLSGAEQREPSIMDRGACEEGGGLLCTAHLTHTSSDSSFAMLGWVDSDGDGIFDVLDVPLTLEGVGSYDATRGEYRFVGTSSVQTSPNLNSSGTKNDITTNHVSKAEYRIDQGAWQEAERYDRFTAEIDLTIPMSPGQEIEIRTVDDRTRENSGIASPIFHGNTDQQTSTLLPGINGAVWDDLDADGQWDPNEPALAGRTVQLVDLNGDPISIRKGVEPDDYPQSSTLLNNVIPEATLTAVGNGALDNSVVSLAAPSPATGRVFANFCGGFCTEWTKESRRLRISFNSPVTTVSVDAVGKNNDDLGRLEIYDTNDNLLARYTTGSLAAGQRETMTLSLPTADIAYAVAGAHSDRTVLLDNLQFGAETAAVTDANGVYRLGYLEPGDYQVQVVVGGSDQTTNPASGEANVTLAAGQAVGQVDFGIFRSGSQWQHPTNRFDVNDDDHITPIDVLQIVNVLNSVGPHTLVDRPTPPYLDVNGDGNVTSNDVLQLVNFLNSHGASEGESAAGPSVPGTAGGLDEPGSEGESAVMPADPAAAFAPVDVSLQASSTRPTSVIRTSDGPLPPHQESRAVPAAERVFAGAAAAQRTTWGAPTARADRQMMRETAWHEPDLDERWWHPADGVDELLKQLAVARHDLV